MKKIGYLILIAIVMFIGINGVNAKTCSDYKSSKSCKKSQDPKCMWNDKFNVCSVDGLIYVACGKNAKKLTSDCTEKTGVVAYDIPYMVPRLTAFAINALKIVTPIVLIFVGMIQMVKALTANAEDEIKKAQNSLVKKMLIAAMVFAIVSITQFVIDLVSDSYSSDEASSTGNCISCFVNNKCPLTYYRGGESQEKCISVYDKSSSSNSTSKASSGDNSSSSNSTSEDNNRNEDNFGSSSGGF